MYDTVTLESWTGHNEKTLAAEKDSKSAQNNRFSCTWLFGPLLSLLCRGQQLDVSVTMYQISLWTFSFHNAQQTLYFSNPCNNTKCQVSDLTNLVSKPSLVLPQINTPLHLTRQALGLCCIVPVSQWPAGKILRSGDLGPLQGEGGRTGVCVCHLEKSRRAKGWKPMSGAASIGNICKKLFKPIVLCGI